MVRTLPVWVAFFLTAYVLVPLAGVVLGDAFLPAAWTIPGAWWAFGLPFLAAGTALVLHSGWLFRRLGQGTPNPWDPPRRLVTSGAYRYVRNPIVEGYLLNLVGLGLFFASLGILVAAAGVWAFAHFVVLPREETTLERRFGEAYRRYREETPRWIPRLR
jgi:protein-S-isoprenylcysteine O-methyltransferase Ste14